MGDEIRTKRKYNSSRRRAQADETRRQIVEAGRRLFLTRGYTGTTIEQIAQEAGVAVETVYSIFGSKRAVLSHLVRVSITGDEDSTPLLERSGPVAVRDEPDPHRQVELFASGISQIMERTGPVLLAMRTAAETEPDIAELLRGLLDERLRGMEQFVRWVSARGALRSGLSIAEAAEITWTITSAEVFHLLRVDRNWSSERYTLWLRDTLDRLLFS